MSESHDPGADPEAEGIPDLQDGTPEAQRASDPQRMPVPGDRPTAVDKFGTTTLEQMAGESLDDKLAEEEPEPTGPSPERVTEPEAGLLDDEPLPDRPVNQDIYAETSPAGGLSAEESAVRVTDWAGIADEAELEHLGETQEPAAEVPGRADALGEPVVLGETDRFEDPEVEGLREDMRAQAAREARDDGEDPE